MFYNLLEFCDKSQSFSEPMLDFEFHKSFSGFFVCFCPPFVGRR